MNAREPVNVADFERLAAEQLDEGPLGYFAGGAGDERTLGRNVAAYREWELVPRVLVDVSAVETSVAILDANLSMPLGVAPVAFQRLVDPEGETAMARAAQAADTAFSLSTLASATPAEVATAAPGATRWFQLYSFTDSAVTDALVAEAIASGFGAILLTADAPVVGRRERDLRTGFQVDVDVPSVRAALGFERPITIEEAFSLVDPALDWDAFAALVAACELPVVLKGVISPADANLAVEAGAAGIAVSNHGGRQLDAVPATIDALEAVVEAVASRVPVLVDGGIRRGTDVIVALALGAEAVLVGRPALWGLVVGGEAGARRVLELLREEIRNGLALLGCRRPQDVTREHVRRRPAAPGPSA
jgi:4-hydroxymandelate oxidase